MEGQIYRFLERSSFGLVKDISLFDTSSSRIKRVQVVFDFSQDHKFPALEQHIKDDLASSLKSIQEVIKSKLTGPDNLQVFVHLLPVNLAKADCIMINHGNKDIMKISRFSERKPLVKASNLQIVSSSEVDNFRIATILKCPCGMEVLYNYFINGHSEKENWCPRCPSNGSYGVKMDESIEERVCSYRKAVLLKNSFANSEVTAIQAFFTKIIDPDMYAMAKLGARISSLEGSVIVWKPFSGIQQVGIDVLRCEFENTIPKELSSFDSLPNTVKEEMDKFSPCSLAFTVSQQFGTKIIGATTTIIKMSLLFSLVLVEGNHTNRNPCEKAIRHQSVMVIGKDLSNIKTFFIYASKFAANSCIHSSQIPISVSHRKVAQTAWNDAGALQSAANGICVIDSKNLSEKDRDNLSSLLDEGRFIVKVGDGASTKEEDVNVAVWLCQNLTDLLFPRSKKPPVQLRLFPLTFSFEEPIAVSQESNLSDSEWRAYIKCAQTVDPILTKEARNILKNYFLLARKMFQSRCDHRAFPALMSFARASAKLCLRNNIIACDAILAIAVYEESLRVKFGSPTLFSDFPTFTRLELELNQPAGSQLMDKTQQIIEQLFAKYGLLYDSEEEPEE